MFLILLYQRITFIFLGALITLFLFVVATYYLSILDKGKIFNGQYILGSWERKGISSEGEPWRFMYHFNKNTLEMEGDPSFKVKAQYKIVKEDENLLTLQLYNLTGDLERPQLLLQIGVDKKSNLLTIDNRSGYRRI